MQKTFPKPLKKQLKSNPKNDAGKYRKISPTISPTLRFGVPFWSHLRGSFQGWRFFLATCVSEPSRGTPKGDFGTPPGVILGPPGSDSPPLKLFWHPANLLGTSTRQSSETVGQIGKCHSNTSQTHDTTNTFNKSKSYSKNNSLSI